MLVTTTHTVTLSISKQTTFYIDIGQAMIDCCENNNIFNNQRQRKLAISAYIEAKESSEKFKYSTDLLYT